MFKMRREKIFIVLVFLFFETEAAPAVEDSYILKYDNEPNSGNGLYKFAYETSDGSSRSEHSEIKTDKDNNEYIVIIGQYRYIDPDGVVHDVIYTADENGFKQQDNVIKRDKPILRIGAATLGSLVGGGLG